MYLTISGNRLKQVTSARSQVELNARSTQTRRLKTGAWGYNGLVARQDTLVARYNLRVQILYN
jgi:hypothetical protein